MKTAILCTLLLWSFVSLRSSAQCTIGIPVPVIDTHSSCDISMSWNEVPDAVFYKVRYKIDGNHAWVMVSTKIYGTSFTFEGLSPNVSYKLAVGAFCENGRPSGYNTILQSTEVCSVPQSVEASLPTDNSLTLSWGTHCGTDDFNVQYKQTSSDTWTTIGNITANDLTVNNLLPGTSYDFSVQGENSSGTSSWSTTLSASTTGQVIIGEDTTGTGNTDTTSTSGTTPVFHPNILIYLLDDARFDPFQPNGGPSWFNTPSINRIAQEGINIQYDFPTTSQCAPSRISYYSGLYASKHGAVNNSTKHLSGIPLISQILQDAGYYTGLIGKYGNLQGNPEGFNWWATSAGDNFMNADYKINDVDTTISGHITDVYQNLATTFLDNVPQGKKFLLFFNTRIPHTPTEPRDADTSLFVNEVMPFPDNFYEYGENYPSYFYNGDSHEWMKDATSTNKAKLKDFQCLYGAEVNMQALLDKLTQKGILDSTIIIFTSDNGYLEGEHKLNAKVIAQEESIRLPLFIRYPAWFNAGMVNTSIMASNIDIPVTLLEAAGIPDTFGMDGTSLTKLLSGEVKRNYFYYQYAGDDVTPAIRAVRSLQYKYVRHFCATTTEEFYDLTADPHENVNQINNEEFQSLIQTYRNALDSIKTAMNDTETILFDCSLSNPEYQKQTEDQQELNVGSISVYPNPASSFVSVGYADDKREEIQVWVTNLLNQPVYYKVFPNSNTFNMIVPCKNWPAGTYYVKLKKGDNIQTSKFIIQ